MKTYDVYLESGPQMKSTYLHVPELAGCIAMRPTTEAAVEAVPEVIRSFLVFMLRSGERANPAASFNVNIAEHDKSGGFLGSRHLATDNEPITPREINQLMKRLGAIHHEIRNVVEPISQKQRSMTPGKGRSIQRILSHVCIEGAYLRGVKGASRLQREVEDGKVDALDALDQLHAMELERLAAMPATERAGVIMRGQNPWSARGALRRMLEHVWEHYTEISARLRAPV